MISQAEISTTTYAIKKNEQDYDLSLEKVMKDKSKQGIFEADFENSSNATTVTVRDGDSVLLNCRVYLLHDKTVSTAHNTATFRQIYLSIFERGLVVT